MGGQALFGGLVCMCESGSLLDGTAYSSLMDNIQKCAADFSLKYETDLNSSDFISEIKDFKS